MKPLFLTLLLATLCAATGYGQTIKSLGYNTTNGQIVAATNVVWTNAFSFSTNTAAAEVRTNLGLGATWLTNDNVTNFRTAIGLGATNDVEVNTVSANNFINNDMTFGSFGISGFGAVIDLEERRFGISGGGVWNFDANGIDGVGAILFNNTTNAAITRTNLGIPLPALTETSNVTMMRALAGSTNTNEPFSGSVVVDTNTLVFTNGILLEVQ